MAFAAYLAINTHRYRITNAAYEQYITYLTNPFHKPTNSGDYAERAFVKTYFKMNEAGYAVLAHATHNHEQERRVIMEFLIFDIIQENYCRIGHGGIHPTWVAISKGFYGIFRRELL
jgi:hypothetical protein